MVDSVLFIGTGGSLGIPVIGCECPVCISDHPKNKRLRPSILLHLGGKVILVDAGPDFREQALTHKINRLDGVILTHAHEDHVGGIDDLRIYIIRQKGALQLLTSEETLSELKFRFRYIFDYTGQGVVTKFEVQELKGDRGEATFLGEKIRYFSYGQMGMKVTGFRVKDFAYVTDICEYEESIFEELKGVKTLVISALRHTPSHLHFNVDQAVDFAERVKPEKTYFTHIAHEIDHEKTNALLPEGIQLAYDGLHIFL